MESTVNKRFSNPVAETFDDEDSGGGGGSMFDNDDSLSPKGQKKKAKKGKKGKKGLTEAEAAERVPGKWVSGLDSISELPPAGDSTELIHSGDAVVTESGRISTAELSKKHKDANKDVKRYRGNELRRFEVKQYHLPKGLPKEVCLCIEKWQVVFVDKNHRVLQTLLLRNIVCWSGCGEKLSLLLHSYQRISVKVRQDESMSRDTDKIYRPAKDAAMFLEQMASTARMAGDMSPRYQIAMAAMDEADGVTAHGLHTVRFDSTMQEIRTAILDSHFAAEQSHLPNHPVDVQLYIGEMALVVLCNDQFIESHPYHQLLSWCAYPAGDNGGNGRLSIRYLADKPGQIHFDTDDAKTIRDMMLMYTRKLVRKS